MADYGWLPYVDGFVQHLLWLKRPMREWQSLPQEEHVCAVSVVCLSVRTASFLRARFSAAFSASTFSPASSCVRSVLLQSERFDARSSQVSMLMSRALMWIDTLCGSTDLEIQNDRGAQHQFIALKPEVSFSQQLLNRFQPKLACGWIHYVEV